MTTTTAIPETELTTEQRERAEKLERLESRRQLLLGRIKGDQALVDQIARAEPEAARRFASSLSPRAGEKEIKKMTDALTKIQKVIDAYFAAIQQQKEKAAEAQERTDLTNAHTRRRQVLARLYNSKAGRRKIWALAQFSSSERTLLETGKSGERKMLEAGKPSTNSTTLNALIDRLAAAIGKAESSTTGYSVAAYMKSEKRKELVGSAA